MILLNVTGPTNVHQLEKMLYLTCGEDLDTVINARVEQLAPNYFHVTYKENDPYDGIDFKVRVSDEPVEYVEKMRGYHFTITDSVYGDDGELDL